MFHARDRDGDDAVSRGARDVVRETILLQRALRVYVKYGYWLNNEEIADDLPVKYS